MDDIDINEMRTRLMTRKVAIAAFALLLAGPAAAQSASTPTPQVLATGPADAPANSAGKSDPQPPPAPAAPAENPVLTFFKNTELSGFVDTYYSYNFNKP